MFFIFPDGKKAFHAPSGWKEKQGLVNGEKIEFAYTAHQHYELDF